MMFLMSEETFIIAGWIAELLMQNNWATQASEILWEPLTYKKKVSKKCWAQYFITRGRAQNFILQKIYIKKIFPFKAKSYLFKSMSIVSVWNCANNKKSKFALPPPFPPNKGKTKKIDKIRILMKIEEIFFSRAIPCGIRFHLLYEFFWISH